MYTEMAPLVITGSMGRRILPEELQTRVHTKPVPGLRPGSSHPGSTISFHSSCVTHTILHQAFLAVDGFRF